MPPRADRAGVPVAGREEVSVGAGMPERATKSVAEKRAMETFGKAFPRAAEGLGYRDPRGSLRVCGLAVLGLLLLGGLASALLAAAPRYRDRTTTTAATTTSTVTTSTGIRRARDQRPRLGPRARPQPVGRLRLREARLDVTTGSSRTTTPARRSAPRRWRPCACCSRPRRRRRSNSTAPWTVTDADRHEGAARPGRARADAEARARRPPRAAAAVHVRRQAAARRRQGRLPRQARRLERRQARPGDRHGRARGVSEGRRAGGDAVVVVARGAEGAGGRGALVRAREPDDRARHSTSTATRAARSTAASPPRTPRRAPRSTRRRDRSSSTTARSRTRSSSRPRAAAPRRRSSRPASTCPYLVPVADPYDTLSPYHDWGPVLFDAAAGREAAQARGADRGPADDDRRRRAA